MNESAHDEILRVLGEHLDKKLRFAQLIVGWPQYNQKLKYPCLALNIKAPAFRPFPTFESLRFKTSGPTADILYTTGEYEFGIQLDVWAATKALRNDLYEKMFVALNTSGNDTGPCFELVMPRYHGIKAAYWFEGFDMPDAERSSLEGEWRLIVNMKAYCDAAVRKDKEGIILYPEINVEVTENAITDESED